MPTYTVHLRGIKCLTAQEHDGDEIYITFNRQLVWSSGERKMHERPAGVQFDEFDFGRGLVHDKEGWKPAPDFHADDYVFPAHEGATSFEVWDADRFFGDDYIGLVPVGAHDAGHGRIQAICAGDGARYTLTYEVSLD